MSATRPSEQSIYEQMWSKPEYRQVAPGELVVQDFLEQARPKPGATVLDLGAGTGRGGFLLAVAGQMNVTMVDFAENCLDDDIRPALDTQSHTLRFVKADLTKELPVAAQYGFCTDVLEHIPPEDVDKVLYNCLHACQHVFFQISTVDDVCGALIGHPLHLTVRPFEWWLAKFRSMDAQVHWSKNVGNACMFYVTAWTTGKDMVDIGVLNVGDEKARENVATNIKGAWRTVSPHLVSDKEIVVIGGGPSLEEQLDKIRELKAGGAKIVTLNGAHDWALDRFLGPVNHVMVDAREFNERFVKTPDSASKYFIASQCDPKVFSHLDAENTFIWHTGGVSIKDLLDEQYKEWYGVQGGSTVLLRAIPLMRMLGFKKFHLFGCDSCIMQGAHHGYSQPENDGQLAFPVTITTSNRVFQCHPWMLAQAQEFIDLIRQMGDELEIAVYGDGMLKHILDTAAGADDILV